MRNKELTIELTSKCPSNCKWCSTNAIPDGIDVPLETILVELRRWKHDCNVVRLSGGEPSLHLAIRDILIEAKKFLTYRVVLMTSGREPLFLSLRDYIDEFQISLIDYYSFETARWLKQDDRNVSLQVVAVEGNEEMIGSAIRFAFDEQLPLHLLALQKQGRGKDCEPSKLITFTHEHGCNANRKITIDTFGNVTTCSALKGLHTVCDVT